MSKANNISFSYIECSDYTFVPFPPDAPENRQRLVDFGNTCKQARAQLKCCVATFRPSSCTDLQW